MKIGCSGRWLIQHATLGCWAWRPSIPSLQLLDASAAVNCCSALRSRTDPACSTERVALPYDLFFRTLPKSHLDFFQTLQPYLRSPDALCVHGGLDPTILDLARQPRDAFLWGTDDFVQNYRWPRPRRLRPLGRCADQLRRLASTPRSEPTLSRHRLHRPWCSHSHPVAWAQRVAERTLRGWDVTSNKGMKQTKRCCGLVLAPELRSSSAVFGHQIDEPSVKLEAR